MKSYAVVDRIEGSFAVLEVELLEVKDSKPEDFGTKETKMMDVELDLIFDSLDSIHESDVLVVDHDSFKINTIDYKDDEEKARRVEILQSILGV